MINYQAGNLVELALIDLTFSIEDVYQEIVFENQTNNYAI
jgi:hypothetical protein